MACPHISGAATLVLSSRPDAQPDADLAELLDDSYENALTDFKESDTNTLVCVTKGGAPPGPAPAPAPPTNILLGILFASQSSGKAVALAR